MGDYIENRVNNFLKKKPEVKAGEVTIRVLSSSDKYVDVKPGMKNRYVDTGEWPKNFPYRAKALFAWEDIDGVDVCFFGMHVQEYGSESSPPNQRRVYLAYLDSVHFFRPKQLRTAVYHEILLGYLDYAKQLGYSMAHIWACPPSEGDDYIFHCHPPEQKIPKPKRLQDWYKKMLDKGLNEKVVVDYKDILKQANEDNFKSPAELPYFEGDFWPNVIEKSLKELEIEKFTQPNSNAAQSESDDVKVESSEDGSRAIKSEQESSTQDEAGSKKKQNANKKSSKKQSQRKNNVHNSRNKCGVNNQHSQAISNPARAWEAELTNKIYQTMEKHREVFFVIRLHSLPDAAKLKPINDPDGSIECELMDGRDAFLTLAREKHYEFSSLRRAKWSSMCMLYELQTAQSNSFGFTCNVCKTGITTRYHCTVCEDYDLCKNCYVTENHSHRMEKLESDDMNVGSGDDSGLGGSISGLAGAASGRDGSGSAMLNALSPADSKKQTVQRCIQGLIHSCNCRDANCRMPSCGRLKRLVMHSRNCKKRQLGQNSCPLCRQLIALCCYHSKTCEDTQNKCPVPFCTTIKGRLKQQQVQQRMRQHQLMQSRIRSMTMTAAVNNAAAAAAAPSVSIASPVASKPTTGGKQTSGKLDQQPPTSNMMVSTPDQQQPSGQVTLMPRVSPAMSAPQPRPKNPCATQQPINQPRMAPAPMQSKPQGTLASLVNGPASVPPQMQQQPVGSMQFGSPQTNTKVPFIMASNPNNAQQQQQQTRHQLTQSNSMVQTTHMGNMQNSFRSTPPSYGSQSIQPNSANAQNSRLQNILQQPSNPQTAQSKSQQQYYMSSAGATAQTNQHLNMKQPMSQQPVHHVHNNNCCDSPTPMQAPTPNESMHYIKQHGGNAAMAPRPPMMQQTMPPQQRMMRHPIPSQGLQVQQIQQIQQVPQVQQVQQVQQPGHATMGPRTAMMQQPMTVQRIASYPMGPQGQQMAPQQQVQQQQQPPQQHQQPQQQIGWQSFPNQHNNMMHSGVAQQQGFIPQQQQINQMGNPQHMIRGGMPTGNMRAPNMMRPVGVSRVATRYTHMNMGHVVGDQDMLSYPNQGNFINRNQQQQQELAPQDKLSHLIDKL